MIGAGDIDALLADAHGRDSEWHGETHWRAVAQAGLRLVGADSRVDAEVVLLFAVLHDSRRENEYADPFHGPRAADRLTALLATPLLDLPSARAATLREAIAIHNGAHPSDVSDPTVAACLDADRLNLWRVGKVPDPALLCTDFARRPDVCEWARNLCSTVWGFGDDAGAPHDLRILAWHELAEAYAVAA